MSTIPTIMGFPVWINLKRRTAKKYLKRFRCQWMAGPRGARYANLRVGSIVNDCSSVNGAILSMRPEYYSVGPRGQVLIDVDLQTESTGCSLCSCGVEPALPREEVERQLVEHHREWTLGEAGKKWFGADSDEYKAVVERANTMIQTIEAGQHFTDLQGRILPAFKRP